VSARVCVPALVTLCVFAQTPRDGYRTAYRNWRQADPTLESDSGAGGAAIGERANRVAAAATQYAAARIAFLNATELAVGQNASELADAAVAAAPSSLESTKILADRVTAEVAAVGRAIELYKSDTDPGIQQLSQALVREQQALSALSGAIAEREKIAGAAQDRVAAADQAHRRASDSYRDFTAALRQETAQIDRETAAWTAYYQKLADGAQRAIEVPPPQPAPTPAAIKDEPPARLVPAPSITPLPLLRYTGAWVYPAVNGLYHGPQPEFIDLVVHEDNGRASGTLFGRFRPSPGSPPADLELRFDFSGDFKNTRNQTFALETSDGAKGTMELIPGPAFNLLEVNFQTEPRAGKLRQGNFVLVKK
jgi:hypothetical protein